MTSNESVDPDGRRVVLDAVGWRHVVDEHGELASHREGVLATVCGAGSPRLGSRAGRERYWPRGLVLSRWLMVVVDYGPVPARVVTAYGNRRDPPGRDAMTVKIGPLTFDHAAYDEQGDVLYLHIGQRQTAADSEQTPEGHVLRFDAAGKIIGLTMINARWLLELDGELVVTLPEQVHVAPAAIEAAFATAA